MEKKAKGLARKGRINSLLVVASITAGLWIGVVSARADFERLASQFMSGPPDCTAEEIAVGVAEVVVLAAEIDLAYAELDLVNCQAGAGPCDDEETVVGVAEVELSAAEDDLADAQADLTACQNGPGCKEPSESYQPLEPTPMVQDAPVDLDAAAEIPLVSVLIK